jgi:hypothetical protein
MGRRAKFASMYRERVEIASRCEWRAVSLRRGQTLMRHDRSRLPRLRPGLGVHAAPAADFAAPPRTDVPPRCRAAVLTRQQDLKQPLII